MKKLLTVGLLCVFFLPIKGQELHSDGVVPFIYDGQLYLKATLNDSIPSTLIYDTGADYLYLDKDYLSLNHLTNAFGNKAKAKMGGAGNGDPETFEVFINDIKIKVGDLTKNNFITPIINLREILGCQVDGLIGNDVFLQKPLEVNFGLSYFRQWDSLSPSQLEGYTRLEARFVESRIHVKAALQINDSNTVNGWFLMDMGYGGSITLTSEVGAKLHLEDVPQVKDTIQVGGIGGGSENITFRAESFCFLDTLHNLVIDASLNTKGALSTGRPYLGIIGNDIWQVYDVIIDPEKYAVWVKRNNNEETFSHSPLNSMWSVDRTDITDGWIVTGFYRGEEAEKAGIEIGDVILAINHRPVKEISWEEQRKGLNLKGETVYTVRKKNGETKDYTLNIDKKLI